MPTVSDYLRRFGNEAVGQADAAGYLLRQAAVQPAAGLYGLGSGVVGALRGGDFAKSGAEGVERVTKALGGEPLTERGQELMGEMGGTLKRGAESARKNIPGVAEGEQGWESFTEKAPLAAALTAGFVEAAPGPGKAARAAKSAERAVAKAKAATPDLRTDIEDAVKAVERNPDMQVLEPPELAGFGQKTVREAAAKKKLEKQQAAAQVEGAAPAEVQKGGREGRGKVEPDVFRKQYAAASTPEEGYKSVLAQAKGEAHMKPAPEGGWVGFPRTVKNRRDLGKMRGNIDTQFDQGWNALGYADPERRGTWYDRAKGGHAEIWEPWQYDRALEGTAAYSAGVAPVGEHAFNLKHQNSRAVGRPGMAYRGEQMRGLDEAVKDNAKLDLAHKVGEYRVKNDLRSPESSPFGVNDFRMSQTYGFIDPQGGPWRAGATDQMHPVMDAETILGVERAKARNPGVKVTGETFQEVPWVMGKAEDFYERGKNARYKPQFEGDVSGKVQALRDANETVADVFPKHGFTTTHEYTPGADVGHAPEVLGMDMAGKKAYGDIGRWDTPSDMASMDWQSPYGTIKAGTVGAGPRDAIIRALRLPQQNPVEGVGQYTNRLGFAENNPVYMPRTQVDFKTVPTKPVAKKLKSGKVIEPTPEEMAAFEAREPVAPGTVNPDTLAALRFGEQTRGYIDAQEAVAGNIPVQHAGRPGQTSVLLERGERPSGPELQAITARIDALRGADEARMTKAQNKVQGPLPEGQQALLDPYAGVTPTNRGALLLNKGGRSLSAKQMAMLEQDMPGSKASAADFEGFYEPAMTPASEAGQGIGMTRLLNAAAHDTPPEAVRGISESEEIRRLIREKMDRDAALGTGRKDIAEGRHFLAEADWNRAVEMIRKGAKPAAAVAALGYSLQSMAAEDVKALEEASR